MKKFNVYDEVWLIKDNKFKKRIIYSVMEQMGWSKSNKEVDYSYAIVNGTMSAGALFNSAEVIAEEKLFASKEELILSLQDQKGE